MEVANKKSVRLASLDAFRGFDMFWIMGMEEFLAAFAAVLGYPNFAEDFGHLPWEGLHFMDFVFPAFLFLAGASFPFSCAKSAERGLSRMAIAMRALRRGVVLALLGTVIYNRFLAEMDFATFRIPSVLGYVGFGWTVAAWIYLWVKDVRARIGIAAAILLAVTLVFGFVPAPDAPAGAVRFSQEWHLGCWLDRTVLGAHCFAARFDPEGFGGLLCTVVSAMLGMFAGEIVRKGDSRPTERKALQLLLAGAVCAALGYALSFFYPIIKNVWSPSYALVTGGAAFAIFSLFYEIVDVKGWARFPFFTVIGVNSITIYLAQRIVDFDGVSAFFLGGLANYLPDGWGRVLVLFGHVVACWLLLAFLNKKKIYLKV